jgi:frataxin
MMNLLDQLETLGDSLPSATQGFDVQYSSGVLTLSLGKSLGTYVINKQPPNSQIWMSSPVSGPKRFDWHSEHQQWVDSRQTPGQPAVNLIDLISTELEHLIGHKLPMLDLDKL